MRQLVYISTQTPNTGLDVASILRTSQANNGRDGITGLLFFNGRRFLQALEGDASKVEAAILRIRADPRHRAMVTLSDRVVAAREFGPWAMADATMSGDLPAFLDRVDHLVAAAAPSVRASFTSFARLSAAA